MHLPSFGILRARDEAEGHQPCGEGSKEPCCAF